jgi:L-lactate dehydrogenase complex protein LldF
VTAPRSGVTQGAHAGPGDAKTTPVAFLGRARRDLGTAKVAAVEDGARRLYRHRAEAVAAYPAMEEMRGQARAGRINALANLDRLLARFADQVESAGGKVWWAADAAEANQIVTRIAADAGAGLVAKSKSMVTEETELNHALEAAGIEVVETDLGEFIVQLGNDRPSHLIAPVLHTTRFDVARLFADRLGVAYTDVPEELNDIARSHLRRVFLSADVGVSGVNIGIADTGTVILVTNEGNGRFVTTAPRVHIALMGMERLVETVGEAAAVLEVLARSGTGQRLSVYTTMLTGPRRPGDPDGPDELHVVILDNGRSRVLGSNVAEVLACIRCGACLNVCPVYRRVGGHSYGSVYAGPVGAVLTPALEGPERWADLPYASTLCGACREVCPVGIDLPGLLLASRASTALRGGLEPGLRRAVRAYAAVATRPRAWRLALAAAGQAGRLVPGKGWIESLPWYGSAWTDSRHLPRPAARSFRQRWKERRREP